MIYIDNLNSTALILGYLAIPLITALLLFITKRYFLITILSTFFFFIYTIFSSFYLTLNSSIYIISLSPLFSIKFFADTLSIKFIYMVSILWLLANIYALGYMAKNYPHKDRNSFFIFFTLAIFATTGVAFAGNLSTIFLFYELLTLFTYPLVIYNGNKEAQKSGNYYIAYLTGSALAFFLPAILLITYAGDIGDFSILPNLSFNPKLGFFIFFLFIYGVSKVAILPMHKWLPKAMVAPTPVSALLHAVAVVKTGVFILLRIINNVYGLYEINKPYGELLTYLASITIIIASIIALHKDSLKERLAYSTISQISYILISASVFDIKGITVASFYMLGHAFSKITLFFTAGAISTYTKKKYVSEMAGIGQIMPITMVCFSVGVLGMIGMPPTIMFWAKSEILQGINSFQNIIIIVTLIISTILNVYYFLPIIYKSFLEEAEGKVYKEADLFLLIPYVITATITLITGIAPLVSSFRFYST